jgi:hypothetical protein
VSLESTDPFQAALKVLRRCLIIPRCTPLNLEYDGATNNIKVMNHGHLKTFLQWVKQAHEMVTLRVSFDEDAPPQIVRLKTPSSKRRERMQKTKRKSHEERGHDEILGRGDSNTEKSEITVPVTKKSRKDIESAATKQTLHSANVVHKKWETLRQCIMEVTESLFNFDANREKDKETGEEVVTRMTFEQVVDLTVCETGMARAVGISHMKMR